MKLPSCNLLKTAMPMSGTSARISTVLCIFMCLLACASEPVKLNEKYVFPDLPGVKSILNYRLQSWNVIDSQSLIVQTGPSRYFLLILQQANMDLPFSENILISSTAGTVESGLDTVSAAQSPMIKTAIERIYELRGQEQLKSVRQQIQGDEKGGLDNTEPNEGRQG